MKPLHRYSNAIEFIRDIPEFIFGGSFSLRKRGVINRKIGDIDIVVPASFWVQFKQMEYHTEFDTNRYGNIVPEGIFIYTYEFSDWSIDLIFRKDFDSLSFEIINGYKHLDIREIKKQKEHLLRNWTGNIDSKHKGDIKKINGYLGKNS